MNAAMSAVVGAREPKRGRGGMRLDTRPYGFMGCEVGGAACLWR